MNKTVKLMVCFICVMLVIMIGWNYMPLEIQRYSDINLGNSMIKKIENYKNENKELPRTGDWDTLKKIGFQFKGEGTWPTYERTSNTTYKLIFLEGFDGPYLTYDSVKKKWEISF